MSDRDLSTHRRFMAEALCDARAALDQNEFPVGCVLVYQDKVLARGRRSNSRGQGLLELDHAEINALRDLDDLGSQVPMDQVTAYATLEPCLMCYAALLLNGIRHIVYAYEDVMGGATDLSLDTLGPLYRDMVVDIQGGVLRSDSLALLKAFFQRPNNPYWQDSLLAGYTMEQP